MFSFGLLPLGKVQSHLLPQLGFKYSTTVIIRGWIWLFKRTKVDKLFNKEIKQNKTSGKESENK